MVVTQALAALHIIRARPISTFMKNTEEITQYKDLIKYIGVITSVLIGKQSAILTTYLVPYQIGELFYITYLSLRKLI